MEEAKEYINPYKGSIVKISSVVVVIALLGVIGPYVFGVLFDKAASWSDEYLLAGLIGIAAAEVVKNLMMKYISKKKYKIGIRCQADWVIGLTDRMVRLSMLFHSQNKTGEVMDKIIKSGFYINFTLSDMYFAVLPEIISVVIVFMILLKTNYLFSLLVILVMAVYLALAIKISEPLNQAEKDAREKDKKLSGVQHDIALNTEPIKAAGLEEAMKKKHKSIYDIFIDSYDFLVDKVEDAEFWQRNILRLGFVCTLGLALFSYKRGLLTNGGAIMIVSYAGMIFGPFSNLSHYQSMMRRANVSIKDGEGILRETAEPYGVGQTSVVGDNDEISVRNVTASYEDKSSDSGFKDALKSVSITIPRGPGIFVVIGRSGSGKSTLLKTLVRYPEQIKGRILFGGRDINEIEIGYLRELITYVGRTNLFNEPIRFNIGLGNENITDEEIMMAAQAAGLFDSIDLNDRKSVEEALDKRAGSSGDNLSSGEKQKVLIARGLLVLMRNPRAKVIALDEPTLGLDAESVVKLIETFKRFSETKKVIIITHDIVKIASMAKWVYVMDDGSVIEQGPPDELLKLDGLYTQFYKEQIPERVEQFA